MTELTPDAIVTYTGRIIRPLDPDPDQISIVDIAHSLSNQCRFTGHTKEFYSVAQHSVLVSQIVPNKDALWGLLHDGTEAYISDLARPIKRATSDFSAAYEAAESRLMKAIAVRFDLPYTDGETMPPEVKSADNRVLKLEMKELMPEPCWADMDVQEIDIPEFKNFRCWGPEESERNFYMRFAYLED